MDEPTEDPAAFVALVLGVITEERSRDGVLAESNVDARDDERGRMGYAAQDALEPGRDMSSAERPFRQIVSGESIDMFAFVECHAEIWAKKSSIAVEGCAPLPRSRRL